MTARPAMRLFNVPAGTPFTHALAHAILAGGFPDPGRPAPDPVELARWTLYVPTRRAGRALAEAFLAAGSGRASLLPRIRPLGDVDVDALVFAETPGLAALDLPPAMPELQRRFLLSRLIASWAREHRDNGLARLVNHAPAQAFEVARSLLELIDSFDTDQVGMDAIRDLGNGDLSSHQEASLAFLLMVNEHLPAKMAASGMSGPAELRNRLLAAEAERLAATPPGFPVIAAGSTGSIPATAALLATIARLDTGAVVLPGLDQSLDDNVWRTLDAQHPQFGLAELLRRLGATRADVVSLVETGHAATATGRRKLLGEVTRPAASTDQWRAAVTDNRAAIETGLAGLTLLQAPDQGMEARAIALIMRRALDTPGETAALITPDRRLARLVKAELGRWSIEVDDSAGEPSSRTPPGALLLLALDVVVQRFSAASLVALFAHPLFCLLLPRDEARWVSRLFEIAVLRGTAPCRDLAGLLPAIAARAEVPQGPDRRHPLIRALDDGDWAAITGLAERLVAAFHDIEALTGDKGRLPLHTLVEAHLRLAEAVTATPDGAGALWRGEAGESLSGLMAGLLEHGPGAPDVSLADYRQFVAAELARTPVRPRQVRHRRLAILGLLEARLVHADTMLLAGLNEGVWPPAADPGPWLNRPQKDALGLQSPERQIGLTAHDFVQAASARRVYLSWSAKIGGTPMVASRWILRLEALLKAAGIAAPKPADGEDWLGWAAGLDHTTVFDPVRQPRPTPPLAGRPKRFSVTEVDKLIDDPYQIFARRILELEPLDPLGRPQGVLERGTLVHAALQRFAERVPVPTPLGDDALAILRQEFDTALAETIDDPGLVALWRPQLYRMAAWFIDRERGWRETVESQVLECGARSDFQVGAETYRLSARADRIDRLKGGDLRIADYKTGAVKSFDDATQSFSAQLWLEAWLAASGAFSGVEAAEVAELVYIRLSGGEPPGETKVQNKDIADGAARIFDSFRDLLADYQDPATPYLARNRPERDSGGQSERDYDYLTRWREWGHLPGQDDDDGGAA